MSEERREEERHDRVGGRMKDETEIDMKAEGGRGRREGLQGEKGKGERVFAPLWRT